MGIGKVFPTLVLGIVLMSSTQSANAHERGREDHPTDRHEKVFKKFIRLGQGQGFNNPAFVDFTVPPGKRIVIKYVDARACIAQGSLPQMIIAEDGPQGTIGFWYFGQYTLLEQLGPAGATCFAINNETFIPLDPNSKVRVAFSGLVASTTDFEITLTGYFVDIDHDDD